MVHAWLTGRNNIGKPVVLEEFNMDTYAGQTSVMPTWISAAVNGGVSWMPWQFGPDDLDTTVS